MMQFCAPAAADSAEIDALLDRCFGLDRQSRTAYSLRRGAASIAGPTMVVREQGQIIASVQYWPVALDDALGNRHSLTLLGPIGVSPDTRGHGIGVSLMKHSLSVADSLHCGPIVLIGDVEYYGRFDFGAAATQQWQLPGPVDQWRVLLRNPTHTALPLKAQLVACVDSYNAARTV